MNSTLISNGLTLISARNATQLLGILAMSTLLVACAGEVDDGNQSTADNTAIGLGQAPNILTRAVDSSQLRPIVSMNGLVVAATRDSDDNWFLNYELFATTLQIEMSWVENFNGQELTLASWSGAFNNITADSSFMIPVDGYETSHDIDADGFSNLAERIANTDPFNSEFAAPDIRGIWIGDCVPDVEDEGSFDQIAVTFGITDYTLSAVSYINSSGCTGTTTVTVNLLGSYIASNEFTELADGRAFHLDIDHNSATLSAGAGTNDLLAVQGLTLQEFATAEGLGNVNNLTLENLDIPDRIFTIFRVNSNEFITGIDSVAGDGLSAATRHDTLDFTEVYTKL